MTTYAGVDRDFGHWLAGFIDGEGCFDIIRQPRGSYACRFYLRLRDDDRAILEEVRTRTGIGVLHDTSRSGRHPQAVWIVSARTDCVRLRDLLLLYPLRAKKADDFTVWEEAVREWCRVGGSRSGHYGQADWRRMAMLQTELHSGRVYEVVAELAEVLAPPPALFAEHEPGSRVPAEERIRVARELQSDERRVIWSRD